MAQKVWAHRQRVVVHLEYDILADTKEGFLDGVRTLKNRYAPMNGRSESIGSARFDARCRGEASVSTKYRDIDGFVHVSPITE